MATQDKTVGTTEVPMDRITVPDNVRELDQAHVDTLAASIELVGMTTPLTVAPSPEGDGYVLVAGFHRHAAAAKLTMEHVPVHVRYGDTEDTDRAIENIVRQDLNPYEEAIAVKRMLDRGLTVDGAAQALGWAKARVTARAKLLELPDDVAAGFGTGHLPLSALSGLLAFHAAFPLHAELVARYALHAARQAGAVGRISFGAWEFDRAVEWAKDSDDEHVRSLGDLVFTQMGTFGLNQYVSWSGGEKKTKKKIREAIDEIGRLQGHKGYGNPDSGYYQPPGNSARVEFAAEQVDAARAMGVLYEHHSDNQGVIYYLTARDVMKQLMEDAVEDFLPALRDRKEAAAAEAAAAKAAEKERVKEAKAQGAYVEDPMAAIDTEHRAKLREITDGAYGINLDLGKSLIGGLSTVDPADLDVARFFCRTMLGAKTSWRDDGKVASGYGAGRAANIAAQGIALCLDELLQREIPELKGHTRESPRLGRPKFHEATGKDAEAWLWKFVDGAKTAGEMYGRTLVVIAAFAYARHDMLPASRQHNQRLTDYGGLHLSDGITVSGDALKSFKKLAKPFLPGSLTGLERAVKKERKRYDDAKEAVVAAKHQAERDARRASLIELGFTEEQISDDAHVKQGTPVPDGFDWEGMTHGTATAIGWNWVHANEPDPAPRAAGEASDEDVDQCEGCGGELVEHPEMGPLCKVCDAEDYYVGDGDGEGVDVDPDEEMA